MPKPPVTDIASSGGALRLLTSSGPITLTPAALKPKSALESDPPRWRFTPNVLLTRRVGLTVQVWLIEIFCTLTLLPALDAARIFSGPTNGGALKSVK